MADNTTLPGTGEIIATDDLGGGVKAQRVKVVWGTDGTGNDTDIATGKPMPVQLRSSTGTDLIGTAGSASIAVQTVQGIALGVPMGVAVASGGVASGAFASGALAAGSVASGAIATGAVASGAFVSGAFVSGALADGAVNTIGARADAKSTATDTTAISAMSVWKQISASAQSFVTALGTQVFGAGTAAAAQRVTLASDDPTVTQWTAGTLAVASRGYSAAVSLTRTSDTNAYVGGDVIGSATGSTAALTFATMGPSGKEITLTSVSLEIDSTAVISGETSYRLYLYNVTPPSALGDNTAFDLPSGDRASFLGYIDLGTPVDLGSTLYVQTDNVNKQIKLSGTSLFAYLVTNGAYTPASARVHVITLHAVA